MFLDHRQGSTPQSDDALGADHDAVRIERRSATRAATVFTIGKIGFRGSSRPCMVRDISPGGMRIQTWSLPAVGSRVEIEMRGLAPRAATVRWVAGREAGLAFVERCDIADVFEARINGSGRRARQPRFDLNHATCLTIGDQQIAAQIVNISVGGARLLIADPVARGAHGVLQLNLGLAFDRIAGEVCWVEEGVCGFHFTRPIGSLGLALALEAWEAQR